MVESEKMVLYLELLEGKVECGLTKCNQKAVDYVIQPVGKDNNVEIELVIPVCLGCSKYIGHYEWVLLYCVKCNESQWVYKPWAKLTYTESVVWMNECPRCHG